VIPIPRDFNSRIASRHSVVFRANREIDLQSTRSINPLRQSESIRWKSSRFSADVPVIP
jgi:hypothetical protein